MIAVITILYIVPSDKSVNVIVCGGPRLLLGESGINLLFKLYVYDVAPLPPDQVTENDVSVIFENTKLIGFVGLVIIDLVSD